MLINKEQKQTLLAKQTEQIQKLEDEKKTKDKAVAELLEKEKRLRKVQDEKNKAAAALNKRIQLIIEDEIRQA